MTPAWYPLAESASHTFYRFTRLQSMSEWWHWLLLVMLCAAVVAYVVVMYWYDGVELSRGVRWSLALLRLAAFGSILFFFFGLEKRTEESEIKPSRAIVLLDTSQSMGLPAGDASSAAAGKSRMEQVIAELSDGALLRQLRQRHDVGVYQFDELAEPTPVAFFPRVSATEPAADASARAIERHGELVRRAGHGPRVRRPGRPGGARPAGPSALRPGTACARRPFVRSDAGPGRGHRRGRGLRRGKPPFAGRPVASPRGTGATRFHARARPDPLPAGKPDKPPELEPDQITWQQTLVTRGTQTRLGDAIRAVVTRERGGPIAGIVLVTDGGSNAGLDTEIAAQTARNAAIPVHAVGLGSDRQPMQVRGSSISRLPNGSIPGISSA